MIKIPVNCYSRVSGYYTSTAGWNKSKKSEFEDRVYLQYDKEERSPVKGNI